MQDESHERLRAIFDRVSAASEADRERVLAEACGGDEDLAARVRAMVAASEQATFLGEATHRAADPEARAASGGEGEADAEARRDEPSGTRANEQRGDVLDRYKLLQRIGEGGFGTVWMADQLEPVRRRVALKIIKLGMDTEQVIARFEAERQALALMDHPNIAKVFDAGTTDAGRPYFVMEYIRGVPIVDFCDGERLDTDARLELFEQVCRAIQHAHQKGVIHRDIKPTNVLITMHDGVPVPKVIDFGIAKATNQELTTRTLFTEHRQLIGTPAYMSPEQAEMSGLDIDTRSDVYSLGVLLYELLTGTTPFEARSLLEAGFGEMIRIIREDEPHRPSTRLSSLGDAGTRVADHRRTDPRRLGGVLRGDLDWIVMKCLEKDRTRRYDSATGLAGDVRRYLEDEPVEASPPGALYRVRKFTRRHRGGVIAAASFVALLVVGIAGTSWGLLRANEARSRVEAQSARAAEALRGIATPAGDRVEGDADSDRDEVEALAIAAADLVRSLDASREDLRRELRRTEEVKSFLAGTLAGVDPARARGRDVTVLREMFDDAAARIESGAIDDPVIEAELCAVVGVAFRGLGEYERAEPFLRRALELRRRALGEDDRDTLTSTADLAILLRRTGRVEEAEPLYRAALEGSRRALGEDDPDTLTSISDLGILLRTEGRLDEAEPLLREAMDRRRALLGDEHPDTLTSIGNYGILLRARGELEAAEPFYREAMDGRRRALGDDHPATLNAISNLGVLLDALDRHEEAEPLVREALAGRRRVLGDAHPDTLRSVNAMAVHLAARARLDEAEPFYRENHEGTVRLLGPDHPDSLVALNNLGFLLRRQGRLDDAEPLLRETVERRRRVSGADAAATLFAVINHGAVLSSLERWDEAAALFTSFEDGARSTWTGANARWLGVYLHRAGDARVGAGDRAGGESALREALGLLTEGFGVEHERTRACAASIDALSAG